MRRRSRIRLVIILVVLGVPLLAVLGVVIFVGSGGIERRIEGEYAAHLPGRLTVGKVELASTGMAVARDIRLYGPEGGAPLVEIAGADLEGSLFPPRLTAVTVRGLKVRFDRDGRTFIRALLDLPRPPSSTSTMPKLAIRCTGEIAVAQRLVVSDLILDATLDRWALDGSLRAKLGGQDLAVRFAPSPGGDADRRPTDVVIDAATADLADIFAALVHLELMPPQDQLLPWLPRRSSLAGTSFVADPLARNLKGEARATWEGGSGGATTAVLDAEGLRMEGMRVTDAGLGSGEGHFSVGFADRVLRVSFDRWSPGPKVPIPAIVPRDALLALLPAAELSFHGAGPRVVLACSGRAQEQLELRWQLNRPLDIVASRMPLAVIQDFLPKQVRIDGGTIDRFTLEWEHGLQRVTAKTSGAVVGTGGWRTRGLDFGLDLIALDPHDPAAGYTARADLPFGSVVHRGAIPGGQLELTIASLDALAKSIEGPAPLPACQGLLKVIADIDRDADGAWNGGIRHLGGAGLGVEGVVRNVAVATHGRFTWREGRLEADIDGQVHAAEVGLPGRWLDIAGRRPLFTATFTIDEQGIDLGQILARAGDYDGRPIPDGFTADLSGHLDPAFTGSLQGVLDHADLRWFSETLVEIPLPPGTSAAGEGALTWNLRTVKGRVEGLEGTALPLGVDVRLVDGLVDITGVTGAIHFVLKPPGD